MTTRERILTVYQGGLPDTVPFMLDLSHWFYHKNRLPWDISAAYEQPETELIDYHKKVGAGFYMPNLASFFAVEYAGDVEVITEKRQKRANPEIVWRFNTPAGSIERARAWEDATYAWAVNRWGVSSEPDLKVLAYAMSSRRFTPKWENYHAWVDCVGDDGVVYISPGYSAMGYLMNYWMGVEQTIYAAIDMPDTLHETVDAINCNTLDLIDLIASSPAEIVIMGDNFSSDIQPPSFFDEWSRPFYEEAVRRLHRAGKFVAVHIDGRLRGAIGMIRNTGADCGDAITPTPMGDLSPEQCRAEAGPDFILSGGVSPELWLPNVPVSVFEAKVIEWLSLKEHGPRLIAGAGDQVPPGADEDRIAIMRDLVDIHGRF